MYNAVTYSIQIFNSFVVANDEKPSGCRERDDEAPENEEKR
jgi:hypothetical protein